MDTSRIDDLKRRIEDLRDQRARIDYAIELHTAELHALEAKGQDEEKGAEVLEVKPALLPKTALHRGPPAPHSRPLIAGCTHLLPQEGQVGRETAPSSSEVRYRSMLRTSGD